MIVCVCVCVCVCVFVRARTCTHVYACVCDVMLPFSMLNISTSFTLADYLMKEELNSDPLLKTLPPCSQIKQD